MIDTSLMCSGEEAAETSYLPKDKQIGTSWAQTHGLRI